MTTTSILMSHGEKRVYTGPARRPMLDSTNLREGLRPRPTALPESGFGAAPSSPPPRPGPSLIVPASNPTLRPSLR